MINNRINAICSCVDGKVVAEVGADHGYITKELFNQSKIKFAYLTDISQKCLNKAINNFSNSQYVNNVQFYVGNGLFALTDNNVKNVEQVIIAGMGANEIISILSADKSKKFANFVLQPQRNVVDLRAFLQDNGFEIQKDFMVKEGKIFYNVLKVKRVEDKVQLTKQQLLFGKDNLDLQNKDFLEYIDYMINKITTFKVITQDNKQLLSELNKLKK